MNLMLDPDNPVDLGGYLMKHPLLTAAQLFDFWEWYVFFDGRKPGFLFTLTRRVATATIEEEGVPAASARMQHMVDFNELVPGHGKLCREWLCGERQDHSHDNLMIGHVRFRYLLERELTRVGVPDVPYTLAMVIFHVQSTICKFTHTF